MSFIKRITVNYIVDDVPKSFKADWFCNDLIYLVHPGLFNEFIFNVTGAGHNHRLSNLVIPVKLTYSF